MTTLRPGAPPRVSSDRLTTLARRLVTTPVTAGLLLLAAYLALLPLMDPGGFLGTDTGGKVATLEAMVDGDTLDPDVGYWAEDVDPRGQVHPLFYTFELGDRWVNATTFPILLAARPLYDLGGYHLTLLLPMAGAIAAAFAARALARRLGGREWTVFWVVGLLSPLAIYALDFWEHSLGVALMVWAVVPLYDLVFGEARWSQGLVAGALYGAAATMRTEALVYGFVTVAMTCVLLVAQRRDLRRALFTGVSAVVGLAVPLALNVALEHALLGQSLRSTRAESAGSRGGDSLALRAKEAVVTSVGPRASFDVESILIGLVAVALIAYAVYRARSRGGERAAVAALTAVVVLYALRLFEGPGFVPGLLFAAPLGAAALVTGWDTARTRFVVLAGLAPLPLVWAFQYTGGAAPQWGARYALTSGTLLVVVGLVGTRSVTGVRRTLIALSMAITALGLVWLADRSSDVARSAEAFTDRDEPVLVTTIAHQVREYGARADDRLWLTAPFEDDRRLALEVIEDAGFDEFGWVTPAGAEPEEFDGWVAVGTDQLPFIGGLRFDVTTYRATAAP